MNYRHIYHAGNFADVFKHSILTLLLEYLCRKDKPCVFIDTHAGLGLYDLLDERAQKTKEAESGILRLLQEPKPIDELSKYLDIVKSFKQDGQQLYPGSPLIMQAMQREFDHLVLNELHPEDSVTLKKQLKGGHNVHIHQRDAYELLPAILPPKPARGLILIDPPFEKRDEFSRFKTAIQKSLKRFATGTYVFWYPIVDKSYVNKIIEIKRAVNVDVLKAEITLDKVYHANQGLIGCGVLIINPPWQIEQPIENITRYLKSVFAP